MKKATKYSFHDDDSEGEALAQTNMSQHSGYGDDDFCVDARQAIQRLIGANNATVCFVAGSTGANLLAIASHLRPHEAIIATELGHIVGKEGGAVEATGHKILVERGVEGKLTPEQIQSAVDRSSEFAWQPKARMVFISNTTEVGTVYNKSEFEAIAAICKRLSLLLLMDGARLGAALTSAKNDMTLKDIYDLTDTFWIGGTKNGALLGEAIVIKDPAFGADFPYHMKQRGMLLAKGRVLGIQFSTLLQDNLYFRLARHSNNAAAEMSTALVRMGYDMWMRTDSNQVFVIFPPALVQVLAKDFDFFVWKYLSDTALVVRLVTSWATDLSKVERLCSIVGEGSERT
ncbi:beta-eliminating lyase [Mollisia scopiformis]|uniref:Beta-eliminating lyase n=1 Tax=Mollisia scopiformis TaxID=149040 RepID=A0A194X7M8_MOLSC|nr:beta-eliminating lyase [Mollisia scopiformis]KUJ16109.1 beta-eliminating lyase [Mollisia scopiformis]